MMRGMRSPTLPLTMIGLMKGYSLLKAATISGCVISMSPQILTSPSFFAAATVFSQAAFGSGLKSAAFVTDATTEKHRAATRIVLIALSFIKLVDESRIVQLSQVMDVPQRGGADRLRRGILQAAERVRVRDALEVGIGLGRELRDAVVAHARRLGHAALEPF